jgi:hypothetical protein
MEKITAKQIHAEFDSASDLILEKAVQNRKVIDLQTVAKAKIANRIKALGFSNSKDVLSYREIKQKQFEADLPIYYREKYPFLKFITEEQLNRICYKYNLVYSPVSNYTGDVPLKNLNEIEQAKISKDDFVECPIKPAIVDEMENKIEIEKRTTNNIDRLIPLLEKLKIVNDTHYKELIEYDIRRSSLFIAAPEYLFKESKRKGNELISENPDPIVFKFVKGGVLIISKWGDEANDPELVIPELN